MLYFLETDPFVCFQTHSPQGECVVGCIIFVIAWIPMDAATKLLCLGSLASSIT